MSGKPVLKCSTFLNSHMTKCHTNWVPRDALVIFAMEQIRRRVAILGNRERLEAELRSLQENAKAQRGDTERRLDEMRRKMADLDRQLTRALGVKIAARDDAELAAASQVYEERRAERAKAETEVRRLESELGLLAGASSDAVAHALTYLERFDRLLRHLPDDQLRRVFDALGVRIRIHFAPNTDLKRPRLRRMTVGGAMTFINDKTPAVAEVMPIDPKIECNDDGCGGRI